MFRRFPYLPARWVLAVVFLLWVLSLAVPAVQVGEGSPLRGAGVLMRGWRGIDYGIVGWYANPVFVLALIFAAMARDRSAAWLSGVVVLLALSSTMSEPILRLRFASVPEISLLAGYYCWLAATITLLLWSIARVVSAGRTQRVAEDRISGECGSNRD